MATVITREAVEAIKIDSSKDISKNIYFRENTDFVDNKGIVTNKKPRNNKISKNIYYDYSKIDGYNCAINIVVSQRGIGKTFGKIKSFVEAYIKRGDRFVYVVETGEMVKELSRNNGERFFSALNEYYDDADTGRKRYFREKIFNMKVDGENEIKSLKDTNSRIKGGTIYINNETAGYIIDLNSFSELKRNNFNKVKNIIVDEFIGEVINKRALENPHKISSIIQTVGRLRNIKIYLLGNAIRKSDPILCRIGFKLDKYGFYKKYDEYGLLAILHYVDPDQYKQFTYLLQRSVAGRFSKLLKEDNEERNEFIEHLPGDRILKYGDLKSYKNGFRVSIMKGDNVITVQQIADDKYAVIPFNQSRCCSIGCVRREDMGHKMGFIIVYYPDIKEMLQRLLLADTLYFYSEVEYTMLKDIIK